MIPYTDVERASYACESQSEIDWDIDDQESPFLMVTCLLVSKLLSTDR